MKPAGAVYGTYTGDGSAQNIQIGFQPAAVMIFNETDGGVFAWSASMTDAHVADVDAGTHATSNGVTPYAGTVAANNAGFTVGTSLSTSAKVYHYVAWRGEAGG